jgi:hypothetical protein
VIVRDSGEAWQVVLQTDHAELSGAFASAWAERDRLHESLALATVRHDDGWAVWERAPLVAGSGKPVDFLEVDVAVHIAFYRACIAVVSEQDAYAGLLVSMHGAGIYRQRYGRDPSIQRSYNEETERQVEAFVTEQEGRYEERLADAGVSDGERWRDYELLQLYDRLSLYFCLRDLEAGEAAEIQGYRVEPVAPWRVRLEPYPFVQRPMRFSLVRRLLQKSGRPDVLAAEPENVEITVEPQSQTG